MPRTRAQAQAQEVESPLVSLEIPRPTDTKTKRGRKPKKAAIAATEETTQENFQNKSILATAEAKENRLRAQKEVATAAQAAQLDEQPKKELSAKQKGKKRALESNNDENLTDGPPRAQRRRIRPPPGQTPRSKRRTPTTNPGRSLSYLDTVRQRAMGGERASAHSSMFHLDEAMTNFQEQEQAQQAAREAAEEEARNAITRKAMERHMVLGPIPENMQSSFQIPVYEDIEDEGHEDENQPVETPTSNNWGLRSLLSSVTGSVRRRLPFVRQAPDQAVPFAAGGGATPVRVNGAVAPVTETNDTQNADVDMTYSLFPRIPSPPRIEPSSNGKAKTDKQNDERGKSTAPVKEIVQVPGTEQTDQNRTTGEPQKVDTQVVAEAGSHKRKRAPSPDVIPNPPGCSYGMDLDYFTYSDDEIEEAEEYSRREREREAASAEPTVPAPTTRPPEKRARFLSPEPAPSNARIQTTNTTTQTHWQAPTPPGWDRPTTTVYQGQMFQGTHTNRFPRSHVPQPIQQPVAQPSSPVRTPASQPRVEPPAQQMVQQPLPQPSVQTPVEQQTRQVFQQQRATGDSTNGLSLHQPHDRSIAAATKQNASDETTHLPPIKPISASARGQPVTERSRPKTPSRLRNYIPLSSSPASQASPTQTSTTMHQQDQEDLLQVFGDDEDGRQAFELYQSCPSGDLSKVQWPSFDPLPANSILQTTHLTSVSAGQQRASHSSFQKSFEEFQTQLNQGLIDTDEILSDLPL